MADEGNRTHTHFSSLEAKIQNLTTAPTEAVAGDFYYDTSNNRLSVYNGANWVNSGSFSTTTSTSTSTSTTTTSTSTTSTSSSTSTTTSTSTSTTTSTTTTF